MPGHCRRKEGRAGTTGQSTRAASARVDMMRAGRIVLYQDVCDKKCRCGRSIVQGVKRFLKGSDNLQGCWVNARVRGILRCRHLLPAVAIAICPYTIIKNTRFDFVTHERAFAGAITRSASTKGTVEVFLRSFIELLYCQSPSCRLIRTARTRRVVTRVAFSERIHVSIIIIFIFHAIKTGWGRAITNISEEGRGRRL
ncbi:hypothetical protein AX14_000563 [Amanita brunnescens Koide BX004]|nr:hypothetical protein AX14_000563 [Amanita brunnescens Koide BX004]